MSSYPLWRPLVNKGAVTILNDSHDTFISSAEEFVDSYLKKNFAIPMAQKRRPEKRKSGIKLSRTSSIDDLQEYGKW